MSATSSPEATGTRLDTELVRRGLAPSREAARRAVEAGLVTVDGAPARKPARPVRAQQRLALIDGPGGDTGGPGQADGAGPAAYLVGYVSRAGGKLASALDAFGLSPAGQRCLDAGASTGGFTDCLLQRGAASVVAVDVGTGQLHPRLRRHPRVDSRERTDIRTLEPAAIGGPAGFTVADLSFISLRLVLGALARLTAPGAPVLALVKPQFEVGRAEATRRQGVIRQPATWRLVLDEVVASADDLDMSLRDATVAGVPGAGGNVEFVVWLSPVGAAGPTAAERADEPAVDPGAVLDRVVALAAGRAGVVL